MPATPTIHAVPRPPTQDTWDQPAWVKQLTEGMVPKVAAVLDALVRRGGSATYPMLRALSRRALAHAVRLRLVVHLGRGHYRLADAPKDRDRARALQGVCSHLSAAIAHGWSVAHEPELPHVTVPRGRRVARSRRRGVVVHRRRLSAQELARGVTSPLRTVVDCAISLPFGEALAVADSAVRSGMVSAMQVRRALATVRGPGSGIARRVAKVVSHLAANPLESMLRAICLGVPGFSPEPQVRIADAEFTAYADIGDARLRIIVEAEGFAYHGQRHEFLSDINRFTRIAAKGWLILRFSWRDVFRRPQYVAARIAEAVRSQQAQLRQVHPVG